MTDLPALREAVAAVAAGIPYVGLGETLEAALLRVSRSEQARQKIVLALPALLDEVEAARAVLETSEIAWFFAKWPASKTSDQVAMLVDRAAWQAWQARAGKGQA